jgi:cell division protein FtsA
MNRKGDKSFIVGLDIGTSKMVALVGEYAAGQVRSK